MAAFREVGVSLQGQTGALQSSLVWRFSSGASCMCFTCSSKELDWVTDISVNANSLTSCSGGPQSPSKLSEPGFAHSALTQCLARQFSGHVSKSMGVSCEIFASC